MIDLHSHVLAGLDDGPQTLSQSIALIKQASEQGVTHLMCTPHIHAGTFDNSQQTIEPAFEKALQATRDANIPIKLAYASEVRLSLEIPNWVSTKTLPMLGQYQGKQLLLLELPHSHIPAGADSLIKWLHKNGVQTVIPHPERNRDILSNYDKALWLKRLGVLFQATAGAFVGTFGDKVSECVWQMLDERLISYVASDMHNLHKRPNEMRDAREKISQEKGDMIAQSLVNGFALELTRDVKWR